MNHYENLVRTAHIAALVAAGVAAFGASIGFWHLTGNWIIAAITGVGIASILAFGWHALITAASRARRMATRATVTALGVLLVGVAIASSGWMLASAIGGHQALSLHNREQIQAHATALTDAHARVTAQGPLRDAVENGAAVYRTYVDEERLSGCGPRCRAYDGMASHMQQVVVDLDTQIADADKAFAKGRDALQAARNGDDVEAALTTVATVVAELNAVNLSADNVSLVRFTSGADGVRTTGTDQIGAEIMALDADLPDPVAVPYYQSITPAQAVWDYRGKVAGAWVAALAIDVAPLIALIWVLVLAGEPLLREKRTPVKPHTNADIRSEERDLEARNG